MPQSLFAPQVSTRSAVELQSAAAAVLRSSGYAALAFVACDVRDGCVVLEGTVPTYYLKQIAQSIVQRVISGGRVDNQLAVRQPQQGTRAGI